MKLFLNNLTGSVMKVKIFLALFIVAGSVYAQSDSLVIKKIFSQALSNGKSYSSLDYLSNKIGGRLSGSPQAAKAVEWARQAMIEAGADTVYLQECMVPHWVRGAKEQAKLSSAKSKVNKNVAICALGGSIATPAAGITAGVIEVKSFEELAKLGKEKVKGKIVFFNRPMDPTEVVTFHAYGGAVGQRVWGAIEAAKYGAVGSVVRSMSLINEDAPHTGVMYYNDTFPKIPSCAISTNGANFLSQLISKDNNAQFFFKMDCKTLPDERSYNVVGEIRGSEHPEEIVVVGGHLDAWDNGDGAHDDGAGVVQSIEVIHLFKSLGIKPKRTVRAVAFMNEENGGRGGDKYAELALKNKEIHIAAIESDAGGFAPRGFGSTFPKGMEEKKKKFVSWRPLFEPYNVFDFTHDGGGADISELAKQNVPMFGLLPESQRYFDFHHTANDVFSNINKRELELGGAAMASLIYLFTFYGF